MTQKQVCETCCFLVFKSCELMTCSTDFRKAFKAHGNAAHLTKRISGGKCEYEAVFKQEGYDIAVSATDIVAVKINFIRAAGAARRAAATFNGLPILATVIDDEATAKLYKQTATTETETEVA